MREIAKMGEGNFYFIEKLDLVDECFVDALGGLMSVVAQNIQIKVKVSQLHGILEPTQKLKISKVFGSKWAQMTAEEEFEIKLGQIISGSRKDFLLELTIPAIAKILNDEEKVQELIKIELKGDNLTGNKKFEKSQVLKVNFLNFEEMAEKEGELEADLLANYYRVLGSEALNKASKLCNAQKYEEAQKVLKEIID
jgi:hypothetical protein